MTGLIVQLGHQHVHNGVYNDVTTADAVAFTGIDPRGSFSYPLVALLGNTAHSNTFPTPHKPLGGCNMGTLKPGKGGFFHLNGDTLGFFTMATSELYDVLTQEGTRDLNQLLDDGDALALFKQVRAELVEDEERDAATRWSYEKDKFGQKVFKMMDWEDGAYRVTLVLNGAGELKLDVRQWYTEA